MKWSRPAVLLVAVLTGCGGSGAHPTAAPSPTRTSAPIAASTTTVPPATTTTTTVQDALAAAVTVRSTNAVPGCDEFSSETNTHVICAAVAFYNRSPSRTILAVQWQVGISATDKLGRTYSFRGLSDCTSVNLHPQTGSSSEIVTTTKLDPDQPAMSGPGYNFPQGTITTIAFVDAGAETNGCTHAGWDMNEFIPEQIGLYNAIADGATPHVLVHLNRVSYVGGGGIGTAATPSS